MRHQYRFYDFTSPRAGQFKSMVDAAGSLIYVNQWTADGAIKEIRRQE